MLADRLEHDVAITRNHILQRYANYRRRERVMHIIGIIWAAIGFVAAAIVSGAIAAAWQRRSWLFQQKMTYTKEKYDKKIKLNTELFLLIDRRIVATRHYVEAIISIEDENIKDERKKYRLVVDDLNIRIPSFIDEIRSIYGFELAFKFDGYFPAEFSHIDAQLRNARLRVESGEYRFWDSISDANATLKRMNIEARDFSRQMRFLSERDKDYIELKPEISYENEDSLSYSYLLKSLFKPRAYGSSV